MSAENEGFKSSGKPNRDGEGIAYNPHTNTIFISGEADNYIKEYNMDGRLTGREIPPTPLYKHLPGNLGLEALSYNHVTRLLWTCNESDTIYIQNYDEKLKPKQTFRYSLDKPLAEKSKAQFYAHGIGCICALDDGSLLLLEREFFVPHKKIGAFVNCKLFYCSAESLEKSANKIDSVYCEKEEVANWKTSLTIFKHTIANYEGMCLGPTLPAGSLALPVDSRLLLLVADSQNQYRGVLKDWMKSLQLVSTAHTHQNYTSAQGKE